MVINEYEARDFGLNHWLMMKKFKRCEYVRIGTGKYAIIDVITKHDGSNSYKLIKIMSQTAID